MSRLSKEEAEEMLREAQAALSGEPDVKPTIEVKPGSLSWLADKGEEILIAAGVHIYQRGGRLMRPICQSVEASHGRHIKITRLSELSAVYLRDQLGQCAYWEKLDARSKKILPCDPPMSVAETILARAGDWKFKPILGVINAPTMRRDGTLLLEEGYDEQTRILLLNPPPMPEIPDAPTREDALNALALLGSLLVGFPFKDDVARAVALSAIITPIVRAAFPVAPMHGSRAPAAGSGKSYLWDVVATITIGQPMPVISTGKSEVVMEKRLGASCMTGQPLVSIDNVVGELGGEALCQLIERPAVDIRVLGHSEQRRIEAHNTLYCTGNNFVIEGDCVRRTNMADFIQMEERPELRQFEFSPTERIMEDRGRYIAAALVICRAYLVAGRPDKAPRLASFEGWSDMVRSALIWLGCADPVDSMEEGRKDDPRRLETIDMMEAWWDKFKDEPMKCKDVITIATAMVKDNGDGPLVPKNAELHAALIAIARREKKGAPDSASLGNWLRDHKNSLCDGRVFQALDADRSGSRMWRLVSNRSAASQGP
jgi:hypothetical protein